MKVKKIGGTVIIAILLFILILSFAQAKVYGDSTYGTGAFGATICGDGTCDSGETCSNCAADCGSCTSPTTTTTGGGGGAFGNYYIDSDDKDTLYKDETGKFDFGYYLSIRDITLTAGEDIKEAEISIEWLDSYTDLQEVPEFVEETVYHYEKISANFENSQIENVIISFRVDKDWLEENDVDVEDIVLKRYTDHWEDLETRYVKKLWGNYHFEADSPGFSYFVIGVRIDEEVEVVEEVVSEVAETEEEITEEVIEDEEESFFKALPTKLAYPKAHQWTFIIALYVIGIIVLGVFLIIVHRKKK